MTAKLTGCPETKQGLCLDLRDNDAGTEIEIRNLKIERGRMATKWIPADEDQK